MNKMNEAQKVANPHILVIDYEEKKDKNMLQKIEFLKVSNNDSIQNLKMLLKLKKVFIKQLPKMPQQYLVKLIFDKNHQSIIIYKNDTDVIGGICYRVQPQLKFAQIAFLAVSSTEQIRGYGRKLMCKLKEQMQKRKIEYLITFADNAAVQYFKKQGFSTNLKMKEQAYDGYIKYYTDATLMECSIHATLQYQRLSDIMNIQKNFVIENIIKFKAQMQQINQMKVPSNYLK